MANYPSGHRGYMAAGPQSSYNTYEPPSDYARIQSYSVGKAPEFVELDLMGNSRFQQVELPLGNKTIGGDIPMPLNLDDVVGWLIKDMLGAEALTLLEGNTVGKHVFTPTDALGIPNGLSLELTNDPNIVDNVWKVTGAHVNQLGFAFEPGQPVIVTPTFVAWDKVKGGSDQTPVAYGLQNRYVMCNTGACLINAVPAHIISGQFTYGAALVADRYDLCDDRIMQPLPGKYAVSGQIVVRMPDLERVDDFLNGVPAALDLSFVADTVGATQLQVEFALDNVYFRGETPKGSGSGEQILTIPFVSKSAVATNLARVTLTNSVTSAYTA